MTPEEHTLLSAALSCVEQEVIRASKKFKPFHSAHEAYGILKEEVDEFWTEVKLNDRQRAAHEAIQVAAMAVRYLIDIRDQGKVDNTL